MAEFSGLGMNMGQSRPAVVGQDPLDLAGELHRREGQGRDVRGRPGGQRRAGTGAGLKVSPYILVEPGQTFTLADIEGAGAIQRRSGMTLARAEWRTLSCAPIGTTTGTAVDRVSAGDFFACGWESFAQVSSLAVCVNPGRAFNCYWEMPFPKAGPVWTLTRTSRREDTLRPITRSATPSRKCRDALPISRPVQAREPAAVQQDFTSSDGVKGRGQCVRGTYMAWG